MNLIFATGHLAEPRAEIEERAAYVKAAGKIDAESGASR